ncbi:hypothetical protein OSTOST_02355, partial [Ostertagia ostertagi]
SGPITFSVRWIRLCKGKNPYFTGYGCSGLSDGLKMTSHPESFPGTEIDWVEEKLRRIPNIFESPFYGLHRLLLQGHGIEELHGKRHRQRTGDKFWMKLQPLHDETTSNGQHHRHCAQMAMDSL